jgi:hypothetical protein
MPSPISGAAERSELLDALQNDFMRTRGSSIRHSILPFSICDWRCFCHHTHTQAAFCLFIRRSFQKRYYLRFAISTMSFSSGAGADPCALSITRGMHNIFIVSLSYCKNRSVVALLGFTINITDCDLLSLTNSLYYQDGNTGKKETGWAGVMHMRYEKCIQNFSRKSRKSEN